MEKILREAEAGESDDAATTGQDLSMNPGGWEEVKVDAARHSDANLDDRMHVDQHESVGVNQETSAPHQGRL